MALTDEELQDKFNELVEPVLGQERSAAVVQALWHLDLLADLNTF